MDVLELIKQYPIIIIILSAIGGLVALCQSIILLTPSKDDDLWWDQQLNKPMIGPVLKFILSFSPYKK